MNFFRILTTVLICGFVVLSAAEEKLVSMDMFITDINFDENNNLLVDGTKYIGSSGCDYYAYYLLKIIISDLDAQSYVINSWEKYKKVKIVLRTTANLCTLSSQTFGTGFIKSSLINYPFMYEIYYIYEDNPCG